MSRSFVILRVLSLVLVCLGPLPALAQTATNPAQAQKFIQDLADETLTVIANKAMPKDEYESHFRSLFIRAFDLSDIGRTVLGRYWRQATPEQQQDFQALFTDLQVTTWSRRFADYSGESVKVTGVGAAERGQVLVDSTVLRPAPAEPVAVRWLVGTGPDGHLHIYDIQVEGTSMVLTYRSEYTSIIQNGGGLDGLLAAMRKKAGKA